MYAHIEIKELRRAKELSTWFWKLLVPYIGVNLRFGNPLIIVDRRAFGPETFE